MNEIASRIGSRIRTLRKVHDMTQEVLAEMSGLSVSFVSMIERGVRVPHLQTITDIARIFHVDPAEFISEPSSEAGFAHWQPLVDFIHAKRLSSDDVTRLLGVARAMFSGGAT